MEDQIRESDWKRFRKLRTVALDRFCQRLTASYVAASWLLARLSPAAGGESAILAERGEARFAVVVAPGAGERVRAAAGELAEYLGRIGGVVCDSRTQRVLHSTLVIAKPISLQGLNARLPINGGVVKDIGAFRIGRDAVPITGSNRAKGCGI